MIEVALKSLPPETSSSNPQRYARSLRTIAHSSFHYQMRMTRTPELPGLAYVDHMSADCRGMLDLCLTRSWALAHSIYLFSDCEPPLEALDRINVQARNRALNRSMTHAHSSIENAGE